MHCEEVKRIFTKGSKILFFDSYLTNYKVMQQIMDHGIEVLLVSTGDNRHEEVNKVKGLKKI